MFPLPPGELLQCNQLALCIQPDEGIHLNFQSKVPDTEAVQLKPADLEFHFRDEYGNRPLPESYERLLLDSIHGDASLFMRSDEIERAVGDHGPADRRGGKNGPDHAAPL